MYGFPEGHTLVVGVGAYAEERWNVPTAQRDARDLARALSDPAAGGYSISNLDLALDSDATLVRVTRALQRIADRVEPAATVLISFSCHGALGEDGLYYLAMTDTRFTPDERIVRGTGLSVADLARALRLIPARRLLLIVNACFAGHLGARLGAGGIGPEVPVGSMLPDAASDDLANSGEGRAIITACRPDQRSYLLSSEANSFFGQALVEAVRGAGIGGQSGYIGLFELYESVYRQVVGAARSRIGQAQEPVLTLLQGVGAFPVASYRGAAGDEARLSQRPPAGAAVREVPSVTVNITRKSSVISFDGATIMGDNRIGNVVQGDLTIIGGERLLSSEEEPQDPVRRLPLLRARVEVARNVDEDARDDAVNKLRQAERALGQRDTERASGRIQDALLILREMNNGYVNSVVRKLEALVSALPK
jgi:hypothetical protein